MATPFPFSPTTRNLLDLAIQEDLHAGDPSSEALFTPTEERRATVVAKEELVVAGQPIVEALLQILDPDVQCRWYVTDGDRVTPGAIGELQGRTLSLLRSERLLLNFLRHLSGVATSTWRYASTLRETRTRLVDTRKTTPGFRELEKYAVRMGGGANHRMSLGGGVMLKDNHIAAAGSIREAVRRCRSYAPFLLRVEVEIERLDQVEEALESGADVIMLDNMSHDDLAAAIARIGGQALTEASGNVTLERLPSLASLGLDFISVGAITHSAPQVDISVRFDGELAPARRIDRPSAHPTPAQP